MQWFRRLVSPFPFISVRSVPAEADYIVDQIYVPAAPTLFTELKKLSNVLNEEVSG